MIREKITKYIRWFRDPHGWGLLVICLLCLGLMAGAAAFQIIRPEGSLMLYLSFWILLLAAIALGYLVYLIILFARKVRRYFENKGGRVVSLFSNYDTRTFLFAMGSCFLSVCYALFDATLAMFDFSIWYLVLAVYYGTLAVLRGGAVVGYRYYIRRMHSETERKRRSAILYCLMGGLLIVLTLALAAALVQMIGEGRLFAFAGMSVYVASGYTTIKIISATINFFKSKKRDNLIVNGIRNINFADALVSLVALRAFMLQAQPDPVNSSVFVASLGGCVCVSIIVLGVVMFIRGNREKRRLAHGSGQDEHTAL